MIWSWKRVTPQLLILVAMFVTSALRWPTAPERMLLHWNLAGEVDRYGGKLEGLFLLPLIAAALRATPAFAAPGPAPGQLRELRRRLPAAAPGAAAVLGPDQWDPALGRAPDASLACELIDRSVFRNHVEAGIAVFDYIEGWYNSRRRHSALAFLSPANFERAHELASAA